MEEYVDIYDADRNFTGKTVARDGAFMEEGQFMLYVLAIVQDVQGRYLITQRAWDKSWGAGWWEVTGGGVLSGETPHDAVTREVAEETGLDVSDQLIEPVWCYENVDLARGDNYMVDIYHFHLQFAAEDVTLQQSEAINFRLATWDEIAQLAEQGIFLHYSRVQQALAAEAAAQA